MPAPALLLHSGGMSSRQWNRLRTALEGNRQVLTPDFLGHGDAPPPPADGSFDFTVEIDRIAGLLAAAGEPVEVVGHSYGGLIALGLTRRAPQHVRSLALYEPVAFGVLRDPPDAEGLADLRRIGEDPVFVDPDPDDLEPWLRRFVEFWSRPGAWDAMGEGGRAAFAAAGPSLSRGATALVSEPTTAADHAAAVRVPTLLLCGDRSPLVIRRVAAILADRLPSASLEVVAGAGHMGPLTHGAEVQAAILAHLDRVDAAAQAG